jgi:hypothetical protein
MADIEKVLTDTPEPVTVIWKKMDCWALSSVRCVLLDMVRRGKARSVLADDPARRRMIRYYARAEAA